MKSLRLTEYVFTLEYLRSTVIRGKSRSGFNKLLGWKFTQICSDAKICFYLYRLHNTLVTRTQVSPKKTNVVCLKLYTHSLVSHGNSNHNNTGAVDPEGQGATYGRKLYHYISSEWNQVSLDREGHLHISLGSGLFFYPWFQMLCDLACALHHWNWGAYWMWVQGILQPARPEITTSD